MSVSEMSLGVVVDERDGSLEQHGGAVAAVGGSGVQQRGVGERGQHAGRHVALHGAGHHRILGDERVGGDVVADIADETGQVRIGLRGYGLQRGQPDGRAVVSGRGRRHLVEQGAIEEQLAEPACPHRTAERQIVVHTAGHDVPRSTGFRGSAGQALFHRTGFHQTDCEFFQGIDLISEAESEFDPLCSHLADLDRRDAGSGRRCRHCRHSDLGVVRAQGGLGDAEVVGIDEHCWHQNLHNGNTRYPRYEKLCGRRPRMRACVPAILTSSRDQPRPHGRHSDRPITARVAR